MHRKNGSNLSEIPPVVKDQKTVVVDKRAILPQRMLNPSSSQQYDY